MDDTLIHNTTKGRYSERRDWWHLVTDPATGAQSVKHSWNHKITSKLYLTESEGSKLEPLVEFLETCADAVVKKSLQKLLNAGGRA